LRTSTTVDEEEKEDLRKQRTSTIVDEEEKKRFKKTEDISNCG